MILYSILGLSILVLLIRFAKGPTFWDRVACLDLLMVVLLALLMIHHNLNPASAALDGVLALSVVAFIGPLFLSWVRS